MTNTDLNLEDLYHRLEVAEKSITLLAEKLRVAIVERDEYIFLRDWNDE
jgi:hypothetical protein